MSGLLFLIVLPIDDWSAFSFYIRGLLLVMYIGIGGIIYVLAMYMLGFRYKKYSI